ncbi:uncharacterized protein LOC134788473, partial [Penaeus indicus]|uniref:uncharacterized protein LOC134788473 n=1 Tax=Penaeus indicus TaxID=29960 RepID=UPI00300C387D
MYTPHPLAERLMEQEKFTLKKIVLICDQQDSLLSRLHLSHVSILYRNNLDFRFDRGFIETCRSYQKGTLFVMMSGVSTAINLKPDRQCRYFGCLPAFKRVELQRDTDSRLYQFLVSRAKMLREHIAGNSNKYKVLFTDLLPLQLDVIERSNALSHMRTSGHVIPILPEISYLVENVCLTGAVERFNSWAREDAAAQGFQEWSCIEKIRKPQYASNGRTLVACVQRHRKVAVTSAIRKTVQKLVADSNSVSTKSAVNRSVLHDSSQVALVSNAVLSTSAKSANISLAVRTAVSTLTDSTSKIQSATIASGTTNKNLSTGQVTDKTTLHVICSAQDTPAKLVGFEATAKIPTIASMPGGLETTCGTTVVVNTGDSVGEIPITSASTIEAEIATDSPNETKASSDTSVSTAYCTSRATATTTASGSSMSTMKSVFTNNTPITTSSTSKELITTAISIAPATTSVSTSKTPAPETSCTSKMQTATKASSNKTSTTTIDSLKEMIKTADTPRSNAQVTTLTSETPAPSTAKASTTSPTTSKATTTTPFTSTMPTTCTSKQCANYNSLYKQCANYNTLYKQCANYNSLYNLYKQCANYNSLYKQCANYNSLYKQCANYNSLYKQCANYNTLYKQCANYNSLYKQCANYNTLYKQCANYNTLYKQCAQLQAPSTSIMHNYNTLYKQRHQLQHLYKHNANYNILYKHNANYNTLYKQMPKYNTLYNKAQLQHPLKHNANTTPSTSKVPTTTPLTSKVPTTTPSTSKATNYNTLYKQGANYNTYKQGTTTTPSYKQGANYKHPLQAYKQHPLQQDTNYKPSTSKAPNTTPSKARRQHNTLYKHNSNYNTLTSNVPTTNPLQARCHYNTLTSKAPTTNPLQQGTNYNTLYKQDTIYNTLYEQGAIYNTLYNKTPTATPSTSKTPTATPSTSKTPTTTPSTSKAPTTTPSTSKAPTATPSTSKTPTTTPSTSKTPTATPSTSKTPTTTPSTSKTPTATPSTSKTLTLTSTSMMLATTISTSKIQATATTKIKTPTTTTASSSKTPATTLISTSKTPAIITSTNKSLSTTPTNKTSAATPASKTLAATSASPDETKTITEASTSKLLITASTSTDSMSARIAASKKLLIEAPSASVNETPYAKQRTVAAPSKSANRLLISTVSNSIDRIITSSSSKTSNTSLQGPVMGTPVACEDSTKTVLKASDNRSDGPALTTTASMTRATRRVPVAAPSGSSGKTPTSSPLQINKETPSILKSSRNVSKPNEGTGEPFFKNIVILGNIMYKRVLSKLNSARVIVLADEDIRLSTIPDIISRNVNEQTKNSLWILALGIYDFVEFEPCSSCKRCFTPMSSLTFRECKNSKRMKDVVRIMLHLSQKMKESVQRKLGSHGVVVVVPPIPATVIEEESFPVHSDLHKVCEMSNGYCTPSKILNCLYAIFNAYCNALHIDEDFINCGMSPHVIMQYREALNGRNLVPVMDLKDYSYVTKAWIVMMKVIIQMALKITSRKLLSQGLIEEPCPTPVTEQGKPESDSPPAAVSQPTELEGWNHKSTAASTKSPSELKKLVSSTTPAMASMSARQGKSSPMELLEKKNSNCTLATAALLDPSEHDNLNLKSAPKQAVKCLENERSNTNSTTKNLEQEEMVNKLKYNYSDIIIIGSKHNFEQLKNMDLDLPIHFIEQRIYFSDFNKFTIKEHQRRWPHHALWVLLADLHSVLYTPTLAGPKCAAAKCQSPVLCYDLKSSYSCTRVKKDISVIINRAKDFIWDSRKYLGKGSSLVLAPIPPDSVIWAGASSHCTHNYIHTVSEKQLNISFLIGHSQLWNVYSTALISEWISMLEDLSLKSEQRAMLKKYHSERKLVLHFIDILKDISKDEVLLGDWNDLVKNMLFCLMNAEDPEVTPVKEVSIIYESNPRDQAKKSASYPVKVQTTLNEVLEKTLTEQCGNGVEIVSPKPSCEEHQNTRTSVSPVPKKQSEGWTKPAEQDPRRLTKAGEGSNAQEEEGNNIEIGIPVCLEAENMSVKEPSLHERGTRWDKKTPGIRGHSCTEKKRITSGNSRLHVVIGQAKKTHPQKCSVQSNSVMSKAHNKLIQHSVALEKCMLSPTEKGTFVNSFIPGSPLTQKGNDLEKAAELTPCENQEEISDAGQTGADSSLTTAVESSCESANTDINQQMNRKAISIKIRKIPSVSCSKGSVEDKGPQAWEVVPAVKGKAKKSNCSAVNEKGNPSELAIPSDKQSNTSQCIDSKIPASLSKLVQPDTISRQDCAPQEGTIEEKQLTKQELPLYPTKKDEKAPTASKNLLKEGGSTRTSAGNRCWITIENINPHFKDSDVKNLLEVCGSVESLKRPVTQFDK